MTPPTFDIFIGKFNSVEFRRYMADVLSQAVFKCVEIALYSINTCDTVGCVSVIWNIVNTLLTDEPKETGGPIISNN